LQLGACQHVHILLGMASAQDAADTHAKAVLDFLRHDICMLLTADCLELSQGPFLEEAFRYSAPHKEDAGTYWASLQYDYYIPLISLLLFLGHLLPFVLDGCCQMAFMIL
jgi:hypothetical protein